MNDEYTFTITVNCGESISTSKEFDTIPIKTVSP